MRLFIQVVLFFEVLAVLCRAGFLIRNDYPRISEYSHTGELLYMFLGIAIAGWATYVLWG